MRESDVKWERSAGAVSVWRTISKLENDTRHSQRCNYNDQKYRNHDDALSDVEKVFA